MIRYINNSHSIATVAAYTSLTIEKIEEITGLKSEVSQLEYDIINDLLEFRRDAKKEDIISTATDLIYEGILSVQEAAGRMKMKLEDFLNESGLKEKCSSDGKLMIKTSADRIISKCMNCLSLKVRSSDIGLLYHFISEGYCDFDKWIDALLDTIGNEEVNDDYNKGIAENRITTARSLLASGVSDDIIINCNGISPDKFEKIKAETEKN